MNEIEKNLFLINQKISRTCKIYGYNIDSVKLVAVSKNVNQDKILLAIAAGIKNFGENYFTESKEKWPAIKIKYPQIKLHFIGKLQSNKVAQIVDLFDVIHSLDSKNAARELAKEIAKKNKNPKIFVQVNIGEELQKSGIAPQELTDFLAFVKSECSLNIAGLMCVPPSNEAASPYFALLTKMAKENRLAEISMGMSADFEEAIALGSVLELTYIRLGTAIFGAR